MPNGERVYVRKADEIPGVLAWQIEKSGIRLGRCWRMRIVVYRWRRRLRPTK
ncbi:hypothetical protein CBA19CS11_29470 [Caballeronia novacaledonica]|uniref:hypothetical protein n=1 Tax=Caballeronia novacaledonica TaxID=1544861 RepID=UPI001EE2FBB3|nr:hypothetical protein [Caballeronia novacaledonica]GJH13054.1 hypothetical protein CBA19CS11_29470 [Caballeronia novacaledonica]